MQIRQRANQLGVVGSHAIATSAVISPRLVIIPSVIAERSHHCIQIVTVLTTDVLVPDPHARSYTVLIERRHTAPPAAPREPIQCRYECDQFCLHVESARMIVNSYASLDFS